MVRTERGGGAAAVKPPLRVEGLSFRRGGSCSRAVEAARLSRAGGVLIARGRVSARSRAGGAPAEGRLRYALLRPERSRECRHLGGSGSLALRRSLRPAAPKIARAARKRDARPRLELPAGASSPRRPHPSPPATFPGDGFLSGDRPASNHRRDPTRAGMRTPGGETPSLKERFRAEGRPLSSRKWLLRGGLVGTPTIGGLFRARA